TRSSIRMDRSTETSAMRPSVKCYGQPILGLVKSQQSFASELLRRWACASLYFFSDRPDGERHDRNQHCSIRVTPFIGNRYGRNGGPGTSMATAHGWDSYHCSGGRRGCSFCDVRTTA